MLTKGVTLKGLVKGIPGMCVGEIRRLTIPPHMAFGSKGNGKLTNIDFYLSFIFFISK